MATTTTLATSRRDMLDRMFEWTETTFCPASMKEMQPEPTEDTLDYVFEHVESFVCQETPEEPETIPVDEGRGIVRDNSLLEVGDDGRPTNLETSRKKVKPLGQQGDMLDYVFEHVESFVCAEDIPDDKHMNIEARVVTPQTQDTDKDARRGGWFKKNKKKQSESKRNLKQGVLQAAARDEGQILVAPSRRQNNTIPFETEDEFDTEDEIQIYFRREKN